MADPIDARRTQNMDFGGIDLVVPPAAVWAGGKSTFSTNETNHVRTLESLNNRYFKPSKVHNSDISWLSNMIGHRVRVTLGLDPSVATGKHDVRSIIDNAKQWAGGALFGVAILGGIMISQQGQEEPIPSLSESQMAGVTFN